MSEKKRNSVDYGALVEMVGGDRLRWSGVAIAARGIKADADSNDWMLRAGKKTGDPFWLGDLAIDYAEASEEIAPLWERFLTGEMADDEFEETLDGLVTRMEAVVERMHQGEEITVD